MLSKEDCEIALLNLRVLERGDNVKVLANIVEPEFEKLPKKIDPDKYIELGFNDFEEA